MGSKQIFFSIFFDFWTIFKDYEGYGKTALLKRDSNKFLRNF